MSHNNQYSPDFTGLYEGRPPPQRYESTDVDKRLVQRCMDWFRSQSQARLPHERSWDLNFCYLRGEQLLGRHKITGEIIRLSAEDSKRLRSNNNVLRPVSRSLVGKLSKMIPTYAVTPATSDFEEQHGARAGDLILQYVRNKENLDLIYSTMCGYLPWAGNAFAQLTWNPCAGRKIAWCRTCNFVDYDDSLVGQPCPQCTMQRQEEMMAQELMQDQQRQEVLGQLSSQLPLDAPPEALQGLLDSVQMPQVEVPQMGPLPQDQEPPLLVEAYEGDAEVEVIDPRDVYLPAGVSDIRKVRRYCIKKTVEVSEAARLYPQFAMFVKPDAKPNMEHTARYRFNTPMASGNVPDINDQVDIHEFYELETEAYPTGRIMVIINDTLVEEKPSPYYKLGRPNLFHFGFDPVEGELYCEPFITQAWHRQRELNLLETHLREGVELALWPKLLNPLGSRITEEEFTATTAQLINYSPGNGEPKWLEGPEVPQGAWNRKGDLMTDIRTLASITESEQGIMGSDPNGRAAAIINAEADQQVGPIVARNNAEFKALHYGILTLYQCYAHPERIGAIPGPQGTQVFAFADLNLLQPGFDIKMEQEDGLSRNPAVRLTQALELASAGFFVDPSTGVFDRKAFARYAKLQTPDAGYDLEATERAAASSIPYQLAQGVPWQPRSFDDPSIFAEELVSWLRGPGRKADPNLSYQVEQVWMFYIQWAMSGQPQQGGGMVQSSGQGGMSTGEQDGSSVSAQGSDVAQEAQQSVSQADAYGEDMARVSTSHEG